jgi:hypothetical protein
MYVKSVVHSRRIRVAAAIAGALALLSWLRVAHGQ